MTKPHPHRLLIIRFGAIGDIVLTLPAVAALKKAWPNCHITYLTKAPFAPLVEPHGAIDAVMKLEPGESIQSLVQKVNTAGIDGVVDLHDKMRSRALRLFARAPTLGVKKPRGLWEATSVRAGWARHSPTQLILEEHHLVMDQVLGSSLQREPLQFHISNEQVTTARSTLASRGFDFSKPTLGISPGANWHTKRWPIENFGAIAKLAHKLGFQVLATGSSAEKSLGDTISAHAPIIDLFGAPLHELGAIIQATTVFLANDSGPMHIARGLGVPTVAIFGSTSPTQFDFGQHEFVFANEPCSPCHFYGRKKCPKAHLDCLNNISVDEVWNAIRRIGVTS